MNKIGHIQIAKYPCSKNILRIISRKKVRPDVKTGRTKVTHDLPQRAQFVSFYK